MGSMSLMVALTPVAVLAEMPGEFDDVPLQTLNEIRVSFAEMTKEAQDLRWKDPNRNTRKMGQIRERAITAAFQLRQYSGREATELIFFGLRLDDDKIRSHCLSALTDPKHPLAFPATELVLTHKQINSLKFEPEVSKELQSRMRGVDLFFPMQAENLARGIGVFRSHPGFHPLLESAVFEIPGQQSPRQLALGLEGSLDPVRVLQTVNMMQKHPDTFVSGSALRALRHVNGPGVFERLEKALNSSKHVVKAGAAYALAGDGKNTPNYLNLIQQAVTAHYPQTRMYG